MLGCKDILSCDSRKKKMKKKNAAIVSPNVAESGVYSRVFKNAAIDPFFSYIGRNYRSKALTAVINIAQS